MTIIHEKGSELHWKDVRELVVGEYERSSMGEGEAEAKEDTEAEQASESACLLFFPSLFS